MYLAFKIKVKASGSYPNFETSTILLTIPYHLLIIEALPKLVDLIRTQEYPRLSSLGR